MTNALKITGYIGGSYQDLVRHLRSDGPVALQNAAGTGRLEVDTRESDSSTVLTLRTERIRELDGATVSLTPVGGADSGLTRMALQLAVPFTEGHNPSRQFLTASTFVGLGATELTDRIRSAA